MVNPVLINAPISGTDIKLAVAGSRGREVQSALENKAKILGRVRGYEFKGGGNLQQSRSRFTAPVYDFAEIARAADVEPYINQAIRKHREQILKEGYQISGIDEMMVAYIRRRLFEITVVTGITTEQWLRELVTNLITYHNAFLVFRRDEYRSSGKPTRMYGKEMSPIAGIYSGDPVSMEVSVDKWGTPKRWRQTLESNETGDISTKTYAPEDVISVTIDKRTGFTFGTPFLLPVLDDILALRKLEEVAIIVSSKEAFPLYHYKVGTPERPAIYHEGGSSEIDEVNNSVGSLPAQGYIVTSERHEVKILSKEGSILDLSPYLEYFESRVIAGLRLSPLDLGRGNTANKGTATNINKGLQDAAKDYQQVISDHLTNFLILPLLLEGGYDVTEENLVRFTFPTIDREEERANQNHGLQLYMGNALTSTEFRKSYLNKQPMSEQDHADLDRTKALEADKELARVAAASKAAHSSSSSGTSSAIRNQISNRGQPANQYGAKSTKTRIKANDYEDKVKASYRSTKSKLLSLFENPDFESSVIEDIFREFVKSCVECSKEYITDKITNGTILAQKDYNKIYPDNDFEFEEVGTRATDRFFTNFITKSFWKTINPYKDQILNLLNKDEDSNVDITKIIATIDVLDKAINLLITDQLITSERFGYIKFAKKVGSKTIELVNPDTLDAIQLDISELIYKSFIPTSEDANHFLRFKQPDRD